jgi:hypothetical protein
VDSGNQEPTWLLDMQSNCPAMYGRLAAAAIGKRGEKATGLTPDVAKLAALTGKHIIKSWEEQANEIDELPRNLGKICSSDSSDDD